MAGADTGTVLKFRDIKKEKVTGLQTLKIVFILTFLLKYCQTNSV